MGRMGSVARRNARTRPTSTVAAARPHHERLIRWSRGSAEAGVRVGSVTFGVQDGGRPNAGPDAARGTRVRLDQYFRTTRATTPSARRHRAGLRRLIQDNKSVDVYPRMTGGAARDGLAFVRSAGY